MEVTVREYTFLKTVTILHSEKRKNYEKENDVTFDGCGHDWLYGGRMRQH